MSSDVWGISGYEESIRLYFVLEVIDFGFSKSLLIIRRQISLKKKNQQSNQVGVRHVCLICITNLLREREDAVT